jgi:hypothetical protein
MRKPTLPCVLVLVAVGCTKNQGSDKLSFGKPAEPFGELAKVKFGEDDRQTRQAVPALEYSDYVGRWRPDSHTEVEVTSAVITRKTQKIKVSFDNKKAADLEKAWGAGTAGKSLLGTPETLYFSADKTVRAEVHESDGLGLTVEFLPMIPLDKLVADDGTIDGLKVLGVRGYDVYKATSEAGFAPTTGGFKLPTTEWNNGYTLVSYVDDGRGVNSYSIELDTEHASNAKKDIVAALEQRWGKPTPSKNILGQDELVYRSASPRIALRPDDMATYLEVSK